MAKAKIPCKNALRAAALWISGAVLVFSQSTSDPLSSIISHIAAGRYGQARQSIQAALSQSPQDPRLWTLDGLSLARSGHGKEALQSYDRALKLAPHYLPALEGAAEIEFQSEGVRAASLLQQIVALRPNDETSHAMLGSLAYRRGDCADAEQEFAKSSRILNSQPKVLEEHGACLIKLQRVEEAIPIFKRLCDLQPDNGRLRYNLAIVQARAGRYADVINTLSSSSENKLDPDALDLLAEAYERVSNTARAVALLREAIVLKPDWPRYYLHFADLCLVHTSFQTGVDMLNAGLSRIPNAAPLYLARGILQVQLGRYDEAEKDFSVAERLDPATQYGSALQGMAKLQKNDLSQAEATIRERIRQQPQDAFLYYLLSETLMRQGASVGSPEFAAALEAARKAVELQPDLGLARDVLGRLYLQQGNIDEAIKQSRLAFRDDPNDQAALYHLILALKKGGKSDEVPELMKRLTALREDARTKEIRERQYAIVEKKP